MYPLNLIVVLIRVQRKRLKLKSKCNLKTIEKVQPPSFVIPPPFPQRLDKARKEKEEKEILETYIRVEVNIPLMMPLNKYHSLENSISSCIPTREEIVVMRK